MNVRFQQDIKEYLEAYNKTDWEKVTQMIYPGFFSVVSKNHIIQTLKTLDSLGMKRNFAFENIDKTSDIITDGDKIFSRIYYHTRIVIVIGKNLLENIKTYKEDFEEDFGKENVLFDGRQNQFTIEALQSVIAVANKDSDNWKYMELNNEHAFDLVSQVIPKKVFAELTK